MFMSAESNRQVSSWPAGCTAQRPRIPLTSHPPPSSACTSSPSLLSVSFICLLGRVGEPCPKADLCASSSSLLPPCTCCYPAGRYRGTPASHCWLQLPSIKPKPQELPLGCCSCWLSQTEALGLCKLPSRIPSPRCLHDAAAHSSHMARGTMHDLFALLSIKRRNKLPHGGLRLGYSLSLGTSSICSRQMSRGISYAAIPNPATRLFPLGCPQLLHRPQSAGMDPEGSLHQQQNYAFTAAADPYSMPKGHSSNRPRKTAFSVSGTEFHQYSFFFFSPPPQDGATKTGKTHTQGQPSILPAQGGEQSKLKYNFSSSLHVFQDDLGCPQNNYGFASATPNRKFWVRA